MTDKSHIMVWAANQGKIDTLNKMIDEAEELDKVPLFKIWEIAHSNDNKKIIKSIEKRLYSLKYPRQTFFYAIHIKNLDLLKKSLEIGVSINDKHEAFFNSIDQYNFKIFEFLLPEVDFMNFDRKENLLKIIIAKSYGNSRFLKSVIQEYDIPEQYLIEAVRFSANYADIENYKILDSKVPIANEKKIILSKAISKQYNETIDFIMPYFDLSEDNYEILVEAALYGNEKLVNLFIENSNYKRALHILHSSNNDPNRYAYFEERVNNLFTKELLLNIVDDQVEEQPEKKKRRM